jgi:hypothetical protein
MAAVKNKTAPAATTPAKTSRGIGPIFLVILNSPLSFLEEIREGGAAGRGDPPTY